MISKAEMFGRALGKAVKHTVTGLKGPDAASVIFRVNAHEVPPVDGSGAGWAGAQIQVLIDKATAGADHTIGRTVLKPGAGYDNHRHLDCDAFFIVLAGHGMILTDSGDKPGREGDVVYAPRGCWNGFANTSKDDVVLIWGLLGAGAIDASGYQAHPGNHKE